MQCRAVSLPTFFPQRHHRRPRTLALFAPPASDFCFRTAARRDMSFTSPLDAADAVVDPQLLAEPHAFVPKLETDAFPARPQHAQAVALKVEIPDADAPVGVVKDEEMADLFGDEDVDGVKHASSLSPAPSAHASEGLSETERRHRKELEYEEDEAADEAVVELKHAVLSIPNLPVPRGSDGNNWVIRMPNFVKLDAKPFHPDTYVGPEQGDEDVQQTETLREKSMSIKLEVENTIRWRWVKDDLGQDRRQSNSRVVRWSDGSLSLLLGKELFDINRAVDNSANTPRQYTGASLALQGSQSGTSQSQSQSLPPAAKTQGLMYLVAQHKRPGILQAEAPITGYMSLRPTGMQSETHRMLVRAVGQKHNKVARLRMAPDPTTDPEREKLELMKQVAKKGKKPKNEDDGFGPRRRRGAPSRRRSGDRGSSDEGPDAVFEGSDDDEDDGFSSPRRARKALPGDGKKGSGEYQTDDFVVADTSDEDDGASDAGARKKRRRSAGEDEAEADVDGLDEIEARLARQQEERRRSRQAESKEAPDEVGQGEEDKEEEMDVESEEEEDEEDIKIRRAGTGSRKKRAITLDDEEEDE